MSSYGLTIYDRIDLPGSDGANAIVGYFGSDGRRVESPSSGTDTVTELPRFYITDSICVNFYIKTDLRNFEIGLLLLLFERRSSILLTEWKYQFFRLTNIKEVGKFLHRISGVSFEEPKESLDDSEENDELDEEPVGGAVIFPFFEM